MFAANDETTAQYLSQRLGHHIAWRKVRDQEGKMEWQPQGATFLRTSVEFTQESSRESGNQVVFQEGGSTFLLRRSPYDKMFKEGEYTPDLFEPPPTRGWVGKERAAELLGASGVPLPYVVAWARAVSDCDYVEKAVHRMLDDKRVNGKRESFRVDTGAALYGRASSSRCAAQGQAAAREGFNRVGPGCGWYGAGDCAGAFSAGLAKLVTTSSRPGVCCHRTNRWVVSANYGESDRL